MKVVGQHQTKNERVFWVKPGPLSLTWHCSINIIFITTTETSAKYHTIFSKNYDIVNLSIFSIRTNLDKFNHTRGSASMLYLMKEWWCALICPSVQKKCLYKIEEYDSLSLSLREIDL